MKYISNNFHKDLTHPLWILLHSYPPSSWSMILKIRLTSCPEQWLLCGKCQNHRLLEQVTEVLKRNNFDAVCLHWNIFPWFFLYWSLLAGAVFDSLPGWRHWGNCLPGQPFQIIYMSSTLNLAIFSFSISALHCGHEVGGGGDQESPIHKSEQVVTLGGKQVLNSILITTIKWPGRQFICHRKDSNVGDWLRASTRKRKGWRKTWTFFYKKIQRKQSRNEGEHNIRKKTDLSSSWSSGVLRVATLNTSYFLTQAYFLKCIY